MSMMLCSRCDCLVDTDTNVEGVFEDTKPFRYWCPYCVDKAIESEDHEDPIIQQLKREGVEL